MVDRNSLIGSPTAGSPREETASAVDSKEFVKYGREFAGLGLVWTVRFIGVIYDMVE